MTKPQEFVRFHALLMEKAPPKYQPWYFPVEYHDKNPDWKAVLGRAPNPMAPDAKSWKAPHARLSYEEALARLQCGFNVGFSARANDPLIIIDIDDYQYLNQMPLSLVVRSRRRTGLHGFFWAGDSFVKTNIPTEHGEMRCVDQYVVAAGSYVPVSDKDLQIAVDKGELDLGLANKVKADTDRGYYTLQYELLPRKITIRQIPRFFKEKYEKDQEAIKRARELKRQAVTPTGAHSAVFDLKMSDIVQTLPGRREPHPLHESDTGSNFSISQDGSICHCWRHCVSLNPVQFLAVKAGYARCQDAGTPHKGGGVSHIIGDPAAIFYAWREAKIMGLIPDGDPIPIKALWFVAKHAQLVQVMELDEKLPADVYSKALEVDLNAI